MNPFYEHCKQRGTQNIIYKKKTAKHVLKWKRSFSTKYTVSSKKKNNCLVGINNNHISAFSVIQGVS